MTAPYTKDWESYSELNPEFKQLLEIPAYRDFKMITPETTPASLRAMYNGRSKSELWPGVEDRDIQIPVRDGTFNLARVYYAAGTGEDGEGKPLLVMAYGGGYVLGSIESEEKICRSWVKEFGGVAVSVSYRLAPENPWPTSHNDIYDAVKWIASNYSSLNASINPAKGFVLGGTSAGATTMCTISHLWRDEGLTPKLTGLHLSVPAPSIISALPERYRGKEKSWEQNKHTPLFDVPTSDWLAGEWLLPLLPSSRHDLLLLLLTYLQLHELTRAAHVNPNPFDPLRSPLLFETGHKNLPPTYFVIAGADPWRDCGLIYEEVLREECNVKTKVDVFPGLPHGFWAMLPTAGVSKLHAEKSVEGLEWLLELSR